MSVVGKVFIVVNLLLAMLFVGWAATMLGLAHDWKGQYDTLKTETDKAQADLNKRIDDLTAQNSTLQKTKGETEDENRRLKDDKDALTQRNDKLAADNADLSKSVEGIRVQLDQFRENSKQMQDRIAQLEKDNDEKTQSFNQARDDQSAAEQNAARLEEQLATANETISGLKEQVTSMTAENERLTNIKVAYETTMGGADRIGIGEAAPRIDARITSVNDQYGYVMLNVGEDDKVKIGYKFDVYRGKDYLGEVEVRNVSADTSYAKITMKADNATFRVGDEASTRLM